MSSKDSQDYQRQLLIAILDGMLGGEGETVVDALLPRLTWHHLQAGDVLFEQGDVGDDLFLVVSGRLRAVVKEPMANACRSVRSCAVKASARWR